MGCKAVGNLPPTHYSPYRRHLQARATLLRREICARIGFTSPSVTLHSRKALGLHLKITWKIFGTSCAPAQACLPKKNGLRILEPLPHINFSLFGDRKSRSSHEDLPETLGSHYRRQSLPTKPSRGLGHDALGKSKSKQGIIMAYQAVRTKPIKSRHS